MARRFNRLSVQAAGSPSRLKFEMDKMMTDLEAAFGAVDNSIAALAAAAAAQTSADAAAVDAAAAQSTATAVKKTDKISASTIVPASVLSATDAGSDATVSVAAHTRVYGDGTQLSVASHNFTGQPYSVKRAVYYDDPTCADTTPTYHITATLSNAVANFASGRHFLGTITTPGSGGGATSGGATGPGVDPVDRGDMSSL